MNIGILEVSRKRENNDILIVPRSSLIIWLRCHCKGEVIYVLKLLRLVWTIYSYSCCIIDFLVDCSTLWKSNCRWVDTTTECRNKLITICRTICNITIDDDTTIGSTCHSSIGWLSCHWCTIGTICSHFDTYNTSCSCCTWEISEIEIPTSRDGHVECWKNSSTNQDTIDGTRSSSSSKCIIPIDNAGECTTSLYYTSTDSSCICCRIKKDTRSKRKNHCSSKNTRVHMCICKR
jgi:hypothetical protein